MRKFTEKFIKLYLLILISFVAVSGLTAQENKEKPIDLNEFLGARLYKVFKTFDKPRDVFCSGDGKGEVVLDYGTFAFQIGNKTVTIVYFWENFPGVVFGVKTDMSMDKIKEVLGKPNETKVSKIDGGTILIYTIPQTDRMFVVIFNKQGRIIRMQIEWLD
jgi:hypothetical protein